MEDKEQQLKRKERDRQWAKRRNQRRYENKMIEGTTE